MLFMGAAGWLCIISHLWWLGRRPHRTARQKPARGKLWGQNEMILGRQARSSRANPTEAVDAVGRAFEARKAGLIRVARVKACQLR
jgi:hypothetical protein